MIPDHERIRRGGVSVLVFWAALLLSGMAGCKESGSKFTVENVSEEEMFALLLPASVEITPFTRPKSFDKDEIPDGIEVLVRPLDRFGDPVKAIGTLHFELYNYRQASGDNKGERIQFWDVQVATAKQVQQYWDRTSQMYLFRLMVDQIGSFAPGQKYILLVRYNSPQGEHLEHEYTFELQLRREQITGAKTRSSDPLGRLGPRGGRP
jgi:hypothetical protein